MAVTEEESSSSASSFSSAASSSAANNRSSSGAAHYLAKCILPSSVILHVVHGRFRSPTSYDIVFGKETSIELATIGEDGIVQSICEQPVFGTIKDIASLPWNNKSCTQTPQIPQKDLLVVTSDSGKLSFLSYCNEMHRFFAVTHTQLSEPGNSIHQIGSLLAVDSSGCYIAVSAYAERLALFSVTTDNDNVLIDKRTIYPHEADQEAIVGGLIKESRRTRPPGTIWSISFISTIPGKSIEEDYAVLAIILNRRGSSWNELQLVGWNVRENVMHILSRYVEGENLAHTIVEVPQSHGFALLFRAGDVLVMDFRDIHKPSCVLKINLSTPVPIVEEQRHQSEDPFRMHDGDDEGFIAASALLKLQEDRKVFNENDDPMSIDSNAGDLKCDLRYVCSWCWEPGNKNSSRMIFCIDTGEFFMVEIFFGHNGIEVNLCDCIYEGLPCNALLWVESGFIAAIVEMGDGVVLKLEEGMLVHANPIQNISPILDMSALDFHNEKQEQVFSSCGVAPEGSLRIVRSGISVERLLKTACIYKGVTGIWAVKMHVIDFHHSFLVLSFVEETRILSVGLSFTDVSEYVGFLQGTCTLACGLVSDGLLVQIHQTAVRLCLPTSSAHSDGVDMSSPFYASWSPDNTGISLGSVAHNMIVVATSNPCFLIILGVKTLSSHRHELIELHRIRLHSELSCISTLQKPLLLKEFSSHDVASSDSALPLPLGVDSGNTFVIGTHKPSVEILSYSPSQGIKVIAVGIISLTNAVGITISGCVPQDARLVLADNLYVLCGLRNGMLLRFEWPTYSSRSTKFETPFDHFSVHKGTTLSKVPDSGHSVSGVCTSSERKKEPVPLCLQLIALRRIGITPVFLVPLNDYPDADIIALSSRPWLVQTARHSLSYISISFQPSTHVTPVCSAECPKGLLFVSESSLNLVEMINSRRLNVQKFHLGGTPRKVVFHHDSRSLLVLRTDLGGDLYSSDICCVDPVSGAVLSSFKFELGETGKCMELVKVGDGQVLVVGTSLSCGPTVMPNGEAESTKGRLIVLCVEHWPTLHRSLSFNDQETTGSTADHMPDTSTENGSDEDTIGRVRLQQDGESWQLRLAFSATWPGAVLSLSCYLDRYFLASSGNAFYVCGFPNCHPQRVKRFAVGRTRFVIVSLKACATRILVGDCRDGVLFYSYHGDTKKLEQLYCDPEQRLVSDCHLINADTAIVSDRKESIAVMTSSGQSEDNVSPESNLTLNCSYYLGDIAVSLRKGPFSYKLCADDAFIKSDLSHDNVMAGTLLGCILVFIPIVRDEYELLKAVQAKLAVHPLTAPVLGNNHSEFRGRQCQAGVPQMLDGDMLAQFLELTSIQQEAVLALPCASTEMTSSFKSPHIPISVNQVVPILERIHYATS